jgi:hypothetical protein
MKNMISAFQDPDTLIPLMERHDLFGKPLMYYLHNFEMNEILNTPIMDKFMSTKWQGRVDYDASVYDYSLPFTILKNHHN